MNSIETLEKVISKNINKMTSAQKAAFISTLIVGFVAHGYVFFNRLSYHDNSASLFSLGATYESGRWFLGIIYKLQLLTTKSFSVPAFNGILSVILIGIGAMLLCNMLGIKSKLVGSFVGGLMVAYPVVTSIFSFMFTSWPYFLALVLSIAAAEIVIKNPNIKGMIVSSIVLSLSLGIYQAFLAVTIALVLIQLFLDVLDSKITTVADYAKSGFRYLISLGVGLGIWGLLRKVFFAIKHIEAVDYKGMDEPFSISKLPTRFAVAIKSFFSFELEGLNSFRYLRLCSLFIFVVALVQIMILLLKKNATIALKLSTVVGLVLLPIGMNIVYFLSTSSEYQVDTLMLYGDVFVLILPLVLISKVEAIDFTKGLIEKIVQFVILLQVFVLAVVSVGYMYLDNAAYLKAQLTQEEAISYFTQLASNIKACDGYDDEMEIVLVGWDYMDDHTLVNVSPLEQLDGIKLEKYPSFEELVSYPGSIHFMREHTGFGNELVIVDDGTLAKDSQVQKMPCYPDDGSIEIIENRVIVKMGRE